MKKFIKSISRKALSARSRAAHLIRDRRGDLATNTIGAIIVAVVVIGILVLAVNTFFPSFFADMFNAMKEKLNANW